MGHDTMIGSFKEVAYLRRSAFCADNGVIYDLLGMSEHDAGVSGDGSIHSISRDNLYKATLKARELGYLDQAEFLEKAIKAETENGYYIIMFY
jgi:hypothetical protein